METYFEAALQTSLCGARGGSLSCAALFAHLADECGLTGRLLWVQGLTKGVDRESWEDPVAEGVPDDPYALPCEAAHPVGTPACMLCLPS